MTEEHLKNLATLAAYLRTGGKRWVGFDIGMFDDGHGVGYGRTDCGSVGDPIGHGPYAGIQKMAYENWIDYATRVFGVDPCTDAFNWIAASYWRHSESPGIIHAAKRIEAFVNAGGGVPFDDEDVADMIKWFWKREQGIVYD